MRNYKKYRPIILTLFSNFLAEKIEKKELINSLYKIEIEVGNANPKKDLWFKFSDNDTLATTIANLDIDYHQNKVFYKECMQFAVENPKQFKIHFS
jgi:hypothetical protein